MSEERLKVMEQDIKELIKAVAELPEKILEKADDRYASKKVETAIYWVAGVCFVALVGLASFIVEYLIKS